MKRTLRKDRFFGWESKLSVVDKVTLVALRDEIGRLEEDYGTTKRSETYDLLSSKVGDLKLLVSTLKGKVADLILEVLRECLSSPREYGFLIYVGYELGTS